MGRRQENDSDSHEAKVSGLCRAFAAALLAGDEVAAELVIRDAIEAELSTPAIDDEVIAPALWLVGDLWERGEISVAEEHLATEISLRVLALQREATLGPMARRHEPAVVCMTSTMPGGGDQILIAIHEVHEQWPGAGFVIGGRGLTSRLHTRPGIEICEGVSDSIAAVDALVQRASLN